MIFEKENNQKLDIYAYIFSSVALRYRKIMEHLERDMPFVDKNLMIKTIKDILLKLNQNNYIEYTDQYNNKCLIRQGIQMEINADRIDYDDINNNYVDYNVILNYNYDSEEDI